MKKFLISVAMITLLNGCASTGRCPPDDPWCQLYRTVSSWPVSVFHIGKTKKTGSVRVGLYDNTYDITFGTPKGMPLEGMTDLTSVQTYVKRRKEGVVIVNGVTAECPNAQWIAHYKGDQVEMKQVPCQPFKSKNLILEHDRYVAMVDPDEKSTTFYAYDMKRDVLFKVDTAKEADKKAPAKAKGKKAKRKSGTSSARTSTRTASRSSGASSASSKKSAPPATVTSGSKPAQKEPEPLRQVSSYKMGSVHLEEVSEVKTQRDSVVWDI